MVRLAWFLIALIHLVPAAALFTPSLITTLYGADPGSPVYVLLWHRAALFAAMLVICCWAAMRPEVRRLAVVAVTISMVSFLFIYWTRGMPENLRRIAIADLVGMPLLVFVAWNAFRRGPSSAAQRSTPQPPPRSP